MAGAHAHAGSRAIMATITAFATLAARSRGTAACLREGALKQRQRLDKPPLLIPSWLRDSSFDARQAPEIDGGPRGELLLGEVVKPANRAEGRGF